MAWTLEDQLKLVNGSRLAQLKYRLHQAVATVRAERSHARWVSDIQARNRGVDDGNVVNLADRKGER